MNTTTRRVADGVDVKESLRVFNQVMEILEPFDVATKRRILLYVADRLGLKVPSR